MRWIRNGKKVADWKNLKVSKWKELDKYCNVKDSVDWEEGSAGLAWHKSCKIEICGEKNYDNHC